MQFENEFVSGGLGLNQMYGGDHQKFMHNHVGTERYHHGERGEQDSLEERESWTKP